MLRERVSDNIHVFTSDMYAQVTASAVVTDDGVILIDTLPFPVETRRMARMLERVCPQGVQYLIISHHHADHVYGSYLFPQAHVAAHKTCRKLLTTVAAEALAEAQAEEPTLEDVVIRAPDITFSGDEMDLQVGGSVMRLLHMPGHSSDLTMTYLEDEKVLFASDGIMPVPSIAAGDMEVFRASLQRLADLDIESIVQGHGEVILRGEVRRVIDAELSYLDEIEAQVARVIAEGEEKDTLRQITLESIGRSRIPLNGLVQQIHLANLNALYNQMAS